MTILWFWLLNSAAVFITSKLLGGVEIKSFWTAVVVAGALSLVNAFVKPIVLFISLPITILTLGLFYIVINALMIMLVDAFVKDFKIKSFGWAVLFGIIMSPISYVLVKLFG